MIKNIKSILVVILLFAMVACKKEENDPVVDPVIPALVLSGRYNFSSETTQYYNSKGELLFTAIAPAYNTYDFSSGSYLKNYTINGSYSISKEGSYQYLELKDNTAGAIKYKVISVTDSEFELELDYPNKTFVNTQGVTVTAYKASKIYRVNKVN